MFVNGLAGVQQCYVAPDTSCYGKFMCVYSKGGNIQEYKRHQMGGFDSAAEAIGWYFERFPNGDVLDEASFLSLQNQLLQLKLPNPQAATFDPTYMVTKPRPMAAKKDKSGKILSDYE